MRHRHFSDSVVNFIRRAIEVWWPPKETQPGRKKRKVSGTVEWGRFLKACFVERKYLTLSSAALVGAAFCEVRAVVTLSLGLTGEDMGVIARSACRD